jgi:hypothetical protein
MRREEVFSFLQASPNASVASSRNRSTPASRVGLAVIFTLFAVTGLGRDRLYVITSLLDFARPATIIALDVDSQGVLTQQESYPTGGAGWGGDSGEGLVVHPSGRFLLAPDNASRSVSVFSIGTNGALSAVPGSPFATGNGPLSLAVNPNGQQVYVTEWSDGSVGVFSMDSLGRLTRTQTILQGQPRELKADALGRCLYAADMGSGLRAYNLLATNHQLSEIAGSPFRNVNPSRPYCVQVASDGQRAFMLDIDSGLSVFNLASNGTPSLAATATVGSFADHLKLMPNDGLIYAGLPFDNQIRGFSLNSNGTPVQVPGSPFIADPGASRSLGVLGFACSGDGSRLYASSQSGSVQAFAVETNGTLTRLSSLHLNDSPDRSPYGIAYWTPPMGSVTGALSVSISAVWTNIAIGFPLGLNAVIGGAWSWCTWDFGDGTKATNAPSTSHVWTLPGTYTVRLRAYNDSLLAGVGATFTVQVVTQVVYYAASGNRTPRAPYTSWATAATNVQDAINAATAAGSLVLVTNGTYATGVGSDGYYNYRMLVTTPVIVQSVNGPAFTILDGTQTVPCAGLANGASLSGFTLSNGVTGVLCGSPSEVVSNCVIVGNSVYGYGGGAFRGTLNDCTLAGNSALFGGGAYGVTLNHCVLSNNVAFYSYGFDSGDGFGGQGGGALSCILTNCAVANNSAALGGGVSSSTLNDCVVDGNSATNYYYDAWGTIVGMSGGGAESSVLRNCMLTGNSAGYGGGSAGCTLNNCSLIGNWVNNYFDWNYYTDLGGTGGGAYGGTLSNCSITGNNAGYGGGCAGYFDNGNWFTPDYGRCVLNNCRLRGNSASLSGGGAEAANIANSALTANSAGNNGGGADTSALTNCTITGNSASGQPGSLGGGGVSACYLANCIVYFNDARNGPNYDPGSTMDYCCATPLPTTGVGNVAFDPELASDSHLSLFSPCRGAGRAAYTTGTDIDGEAWANPPSIGCDEYHSGAVTGSLSLNIVANFTNVAVGFPVGLTALIDGRTMLSAWEFGDGSTEINQPFTTHAFASPGDYVVTLYCFNDTYPDGLSAAVLIHVVQDIHYVARDNNHPAPPYATWATAATNIQDAVDTAVPGGLVLVTNGTYSTGMRVMYGTMTNRVGVDKPLALLSINGPAYTIIQGHAAPVNTNDDGAVRCVFLTNGASLSGFTLTNGAADDGGGAWCSSPYTIISNCVIAGNSAWNHGGGVYGGVLNNCTLANNTAQQGGGAYSSGLGNCTLVGNIAFWTNSYVEVLGANGGGANGGTLNNCTLTGNSARASGDISDGYGGGTYAAELTNCTLNLNSAEQGGGTYYGTLSNCRLTGNTSKNGGGGSFYATLENCTLAGNSTAGWGGGAYGGTLNGCALSGNSAIGDDNYGGGAVDSSLNNCTLTRNYVSGFGSAGGGAVDSSLNNCILYFNTAPQGDNYAQGCTFNYCCTTPLPTNGLGNIASDPQLASASHLSVLSPCRRAGSTNYAIGADIDGEPWGNPPSIGCDEYHVGKVTGPLSVGIGTTFTNVAVGFSVGLTALVEGRTTFSAWDFDDGAEEISQPFTSHAWAAPGNYVVSLWCFNESNPDGVLATVTIHVVAQPVHYVAAGNPNPQAPYTSWATAATSIQDAVEVAPAGGTILVTNGTYSAGGRAIYGAMTNRVAVDKPLSLQSANGPQFTVIQGYQPPGLTNGDGAVRCVYLTNGTSLSGFTLANGATRSTGDYQHEQSGGGVWCESDGVTVSNCVLTGNSASSYGGGSYSGRLNNCTVTGNSATYGGGSYLSALKTSIVTSNRASAGGGVYYGTLNGCTLTANSALSGGGASASTLNNCTLAGNAAANSGGGAAGIYYYSPSWLANCIVYFNTAPVGANCDSNCVLNYCCSTPRPANGIGNISSDPSLADAWHLSSDSPCRAAGNAVYKSGTDIDGEAWGSPPSIGCDEYWSGAATGPLNVCIAAAFTTVAPGYSLALQAVVQGHATVSVWTFGDGAGATNQPFIAHAWNLPGDYVVQLRVYNDSVPTGISASVVIHVVQGIYYVAANNTNPVAPYASWATAATNIQDAIDAAAVPGGFVLVTNGIYSSTNGPSGSCVRVSAGLALRSVNGPQFTLINGQGAVRCAYLDAGASLSGFTLSNGTSGLFCESATSVASNCVISRNGIQGSGGGVAGGTLNGCLIISNAAYHGGGAQNATLINCTVTGNAAADGGGALFCTLSNCALLTNSSSNFGGGGGARYCTVRNCLLAGNSAGSNGGGGANGGMLDSCTLLGNSASYGGGASGCTLNNCLLVGNSTVGPDGLGGGAYDSALSNCTLVGNSAPGGNSGLTGGGGSCYGTLKNCILYFNTSGSGPNYFYGTLDSCCTVPMPTSGAGNITNAPLFMNLVGGDLRLQSNSPCINAGCDAFAPNGPDLDGNPRIVGGTVDIGAYEFQSPASTISYAWLQQYGLSTDGSADFTDPDGDGMNNWQEWRCGTNPTNALSALRMLSPSVSATNVAVIWQSVAGVNYFIVRGTNIAVSGSFSTIATNIAGQPGTTTYADTNSFGTGSIFYRVGAQ